MANAGELSVQLKADDQASKKIEGASQNMSKSFTRIKNGASLASAAVLGAFGVAINNFLETGDALHKMSGRMNMSVRTIEALSHAAGLAGQDISLFEGIIKIHTKNLLGLSEGADVVTRNYAALGLSFDQLNVMPMEDQIIGLLGAMADLDEQTVQNTLGIDIFKGMWMPVKNLIQDPSSSAIKDLIDRLKDTGFWTDETATEAAVLNDTMADTKRVLGLVVLELVRGHIPAMQLAASKMLLFVTENKESIKQVASNILTLAKFIAIMKGGAIIVSAFTRALILTKVVFQTLIGITLALRKALTTKFLLIKAKAALMKVYNKTVAITTGVMNGLRKAFILARTATLLFYTTALVPLAPFLGGIAAIVAVVVSAFISLEVITKGAVSKAIKDFTKKIMGLGEHLGILKKAWESLVGLFKKHVKDPVVTLATAVKDKLVPSFEAVTDEAAESSDIMKRLKTDLEGLGTVVPDVSGTLDEQTTALDKLNEALTTNVGAIGGVTILGEFLNEQLEHTSLKLEKQKEAAEHARIAWEAYHRGVEKAVEANRKLAGASSTGPGNPFAFLSTFPSLRGEGATNAFMGAVADLIVKQGGSVNAKTLQAKASQLNPFGQGFGEHMGSGSHIDNYFTVNSGAGTTAILNQAINNGAIIETN